MAFHPYPQVIPQVFNPGGFGPPRGLTRASTCPWVDHSASGLWHATERPVQTRFRYGSPTRVNLATYHNSQAHSSKGTRSLHVSPKADTLPRLVGTRFQVLFHDPSPGHFSPFPHGTCALSVTREYLGLGGGPPRFTRDFSGPVLLGIPSGSRKSFVYGGITLCADGFHTSSATLAISYSLPDQQFRLDGPATPITQRLLAMARDRFGLFPFRSPLLRESRLLSLPVGTEMFHFPTLPPPALCVQAGATSHYARQVSPFGNPRIEVWLPTPRGLSQAPTSFFGSWCQGIHRAPLITWQLQIRCSRPLCSSQDTGGRGAPSRLRDGTHRPCEGDPKAAVPSGPNSVLGLTSPRRQRSSRKRVY